MKNKDDILPDLKYSDIELSEFRSISDILEERFKEDKKDKPKKKERQYSDKSIWLFTLENPIRKMCIKINKSIVFEILII
jgi:hypothetical protein